MKFYFIVLLSLTAFKAIQMTARHEYLKHFQI